MQATQHCKSRGGFGISLPQPLCEGFIFIFLQQLDCAGAGGAAFSGKAIIATETLSAKQSIDRIIIRITSQF